MNPLLHWGNKGIIRGFLFLDPLGGLGVRLISLLSLATLLMAAIVPLQALHSSFRVGCYRVLKVCFWVL